MNIKNAFIFLLIFFCYCTDGLNQTYKKVENKSFTRGEKLNYRLHYGILRAGIMELTISPDWSYVNERKCYLIEGVGRSTGAVNVFFKVRDKYTTYLDSAAIVPHRFIRDVSEGSYKKTENVEFDHKKRLAVINQRDTIKFKKGFQDIFSSYYYLRCLDLSKLEIGDSININVYLDGEISVHHIKFEGREDVKTKAGKFNCLKFKPEVQAGRAFGKKEDLTVWITDDLNHVPLKIEAKLKGGTLAAELIDYTGLANSSTSKL